MRIHQHLDKVRRLSEFRERMHPIDDFDLRMWASMTAATNAFNAALHAAGLTAEDDAYSYTAVGIYVVPPKILSEWRKEVRPLGDLVHIGFPPTPFDLPGPLTAAAEALRTIENFRETSVRGTRPISGADAQICDGAFDRAMPLIAAFLKEASGEEIL